ncbi:uncharacterized protein LOC111021761 isoform X2 [Momordica charantia]|uniref:Uncharacterized protein LOC111021761 isoform X2 n=1 Tax=Momordica charantia TaxID=3673 RepID=A0A6J1DNW0_MOMCH|nr:uncharacterized protein LOC111021761 isoform X2 [Momordica charantia]
MDSATLTVSSSIILRNSSQKLLPGRKIQAGLCFRRRRFSKIFAVYPNGSARSSAPGGDSSAADVHRRRSTFESLFCYDKAIPEERIEKPVGISLAEKIIGDNPRCTDCHAKGAVLCTTCSGSGLYVDAILESQGIIVKVRCLGCGGTGNIMCSECGGRGHLASK